ncbi:MAG: type II 3-dehydroquinate dehydratase [Nitrospinota bacterium]
MKKVLIINGPNLNLLGKREQEIYGKLSYEELNKNLAVHAGKIGVELEIYQSNHEGEIVDRIQAAKNAADFIIINAGALTHTSIGIRDALAAVSIPFIEVHLSNIFKREEFRRHSYLTDLAEGIIAGLGPRVYFLALDAAVSIMEEGK